MRWSEKAGAKRVVTDQPAELTVGGESWELPYHPCLSELLYGAPLYRQRREMWGSAAVPARPPDAGALCRTAPASPAAPRPRAPPVGRRRTADGPSLAASVRAAQQPPAGEQVDERGQGQERPEGDLGLAERLRRRFAGAAAGDDEQRGC